MYRLGHHLLGIEGLALLRSAGEAGEAQRAARVAEIVEIVARLDEPGHADIRDGAIIDIGAGYAAWAASYDARRNVTIELEEPVVHKLLAAVTPRSDVLDAACGTGRHTAFLCERGHRVVGVDSSPEMLDVARAKGLPARFEVAELERLPYEDATFDAAVCALALSHSPDLRPGVTELARVLRRGGLLVVSNPHPVATGLLAWRAAVRDAQGCPAVIPEHAHAVGAYVEAFRAAGLAIERCVEPALTEQRAGEEAKAGLEDAFRAALAGLSVVIVWALRRES
jgi:ubiquinone/menaquinone biosynthesis C-methylase UbiE